MSNKKTGMGSAEDMRPGLTASTLKMIAVICMFIDHVTAFVVYRLITSGIFKTGIVLFENSSMKIKPEELVYYSLRAVGRISFPIFAFFLVEGFFKTRSRWKYMLRLLVFALISEIPFTIAVEGLGGSFLHLMAPTNVFYTLLIGLAVIWGSETLKKYAPGGFVAICFRILVCLVPTAYVAYEIYSVLCFDDTLAMQPFLFAQVWLGTALVTLIALFIYGQRVSKEKARAISSSLSFLGFGMMIADWFGTDYAGVGVLAIFIMYVMAKRNKTVGMAVSVAGLCLNNLFEIPAFIDVLLIRKYNGKRGNGSKYFFYIFYPAHIALIVLVMYLTQLI